MICSIIQAHFQIKIKPSKNEQEKKRQRIYDLLTVEIKPKFLRPLYTKQSKNFTEKELFKKDEEWRIKQKTKRRLFDCSRYGD